jgi:transcriptional regulator with XRE-family HTH domain
MPPSTIPRSRSPSSRWIRRRFASEVARPTSRTRHPPSAIVAGGVSVPLVRQASRPVVTGRFVRMQRQRTTAGQDALMDDIRAGRLLRALRLRSRLTQKHLGARVGLSQQEISQIERGHLGAVQVRTVRTAFRGVEASIEWDLRWRGGALDRLLDERHAALVGAITELLTIAGWEVVPELTYNVYGERGSIDLVAWHPESATLLIVEVKTELTSIEATLRKHDEKVRLGPEVVAKRFDWRPRSVARLLVLPDQRTARRRVERADAVLRRSYPVRGWSARRWLKNPIGAADGLIFLSSTTPRGWRQRP